MSKLRIAATAMATVPGIAPGRHLAHHSIEWTAVAVSVSEARKA